MEKKRVLMAMSGGIDSTVSAILLKEQGYDLVGVTFRSFDSISRACMEREKGCCSVDSIFEAKRMAETLGFEHHILDIREDFKQTVIHNFIDEYLHGRTPNPCVICNSTIKWGRLLDMADTLGCHYIATGHYARIANENGRYYLQRGIDRAKDQTYFLWTLTQDNLSRTIFPLGQLTKTDARRIALEHGFEKLSKKGESQEICFIPDNDYRSFLHENVENFDATYPPGWFVDKQGKHMAMHKGFPNYTIGQRKGLGVAFGEPKFVIEIRPQSNEVVLGNREDLIGKECKITNVNFMKFTDIPNNGLEVDAKIRYKSAGGRATAFLNDDKTLDLVFANGIDSITPGQSAVLYDGDDVVAGGVIF